MSTRTADDIREDITEDERRDGLTRLAGQAADMPYREVMLLLAAWAHPDLSPDRQRDLFGDYWASVAGAADIRADASEVGRYFDPGDFRACTDPQGTAAELLDDRAKAALYALVNGEQER